MSILSGIKSPSDLKQLTPEQLTKLSQEIRDDLVRYVTKTGGHLGPNLGVVELTLALHRVFDSPKDPILWDTGSTPEGACQLSGNCRGCVGILTEIGGKKYCFPEDVGIANGPECSLAAVDDIA